MSWRIRDGDYSQYQRVCPMEACGLRRGFATRAAAERASISMQAADVRPGVIEEYLDGEDGTCPHGITMDAPLPQKQPRAKRSTPK